MPTPSMILLIGTQGREPRVDLLDRLASSGSEICFTSDYQAALQQAADEDIEAMIIDHDPDVAHIIDFCRNLRDEHHYMPVVVLEDASTPVDRMLLLEAGADVCLPREIDARELFTFTRALMRRDGWCSCSRDQAQERGAVRAGRLHVCPLKKRAYVQGKDADLTHVEFEILYFLAQHPGRVYSREEILTNLWGDQYMCEPHTVDTHVCRLRKKIEPDPSEPRYVQTVWGFGYRFGRGDRLPLPEGRHSPSEGLHSPSGIASSS